MAALYGVTLGLSRNQSVRRIKGNQATLIIHNGIILDLVCGFGGSVGGEVWADFSPFGEKSSFFYLRIASVRSGDSDLDSPESV